MPAQKGYYLSELPILTELYRHGHTLHNPVPRCPVPWRTNLLHIFGLVQDGTRDQCELVLQVVSMGPEAVLRGPSIHVWFLTMSLGWFADACKRSHRGAVMPWGCNGSRHLRGVAIRNLPTSITAVTIQSVCESVAPALSPVLHVIRKGGAAWVPLPSGIIFLDFVRDTNQSLWPASCCCAPDPVPCPDDDAAGRVVDMWFGHNGYGLDVRCHSMFLWAGIDSDEVASFRDDTCLEIMEVCGNEYM